MENKINGESSPHGNHEEILQEILKNTQATKKYLKWSFILTVTFIVLPILTLLILIPTALNSLSSLYGSGGAYENLSNMQNLK